MTQRGTSFGHWGWGPEAGAELFVYMTHVIDDELHRSVWRSHLISRVAENQRWVAATYVAHPTQLCPSMLIDPAGLVVHELVSEQAGLLSIEINTTAVSNWYLNRHRVDLT